MMGRLATTTFFVATLMLVAVSTAHAGTDSSSRYCVIGAGPGGLQAAYYLHQFNMDYVVFELGDKPGTFFKSYPRHRKLISVNKVFTGSSNPEFNLRFDWNSLLSNHLAGTSTSNIRSPPDPHEKLFKNFSTVFYPPADALLEYLEYYATKHGLHIRYNTAVKRVQRDGPQGDFVLQLSTGVQHRCFAVILAAGKFVPAKLAKPESEAAVEGYETISVNSKDYDNQDIAIIGAGNSALEIAESIVDRAAYVHVVSRRPVRMAHQTHYVGHARSVNLDLLDRYQLKVGDAFIHGIDANNVTFVRDQKKGRTLILEPQNPRSPGRFGFDRVIRALGFKWDSSPFYGFNEPACAKGDVQCGSSGSTLLSVKPFEELGGRFLEIASNYESVNVPRFHVAGTLMHFRDFKRSAGGFIHGFRYLTRTLVNQLREKHERIDYPSLRFGPFAERADMIDVMMTVCSQRFRNVSSLFQMQGQLSDVFVIEPPRTRKQPYYFRYVQDIPLDQIRSRQLHRVAPKIISRAKFLISLHLGFGKYNQGPGTVTHELSEERPQNTAEKTLWDDDSDPDARLGRAFAPTAHVKLPNHQPNAPPQQPQQPQDVLLSKDRMFKSIFESSRDENPFEFEVGYQFLHPKLFLYQIPTEEEQAAKSKPPEVLGTVELMEDVHNQWDIPEIHDDPLRGFFAWCADKVYRGK